MSELNARGLADEADKKTKAGSPLAAFQVDMSPVMLAARLMALSLENAALRAAGMTQAMLTGRAQSEARYWKAKAEMAEAALKAR
jgi:hypothetical protein